MGGTISAVIYVLSKSKAIASMPLGTRAAIITAGGLIGGSTFVAANYVNTIAQKNATNLSSTSKEDNYPSKSIIGQEDNADTVMYYLNLNIIICIMVLLFSLFLIYFYIYKRNKMWNIRIIWILSLIMSIYSIYLAFNLIEDIDIISRICHDIDYFKDIKTSDNWNNETLKFLMANLVLRSGIIILLYLLLILHFQNMIANSNKEFKYIKYILGERFYLYFTQLIRFANKTNLIWMTISVTLLIFSSVISIYLAFFMLNNIYDITELYLKSQK